MKVLPYYAENLVVGVVWSGHFDWYVSEKSYWFLDLTKLYHAYRVRGITDANWDAPPTWRFGLEVVDEHTASLFLQQMAPYVASTAELAACVATASQSDDKEDILDCAPSLYVDFDRRIFKSMYAEPESFEAYAPDGWSAKRDDFMPEITPPFRYWIIDGHDYFPE